MIATLAGFATFVLMTFEFCIVHPLITDSAVAGMDENSGNLSVGRDEKQREHRGTRLSSDHISCVSMLRKVSQSDAAVCSGHEAGAASFWKLYLLEVE